MTEVLFARQDEWLAFLAGLTTGVSVGTYGSATQVPQFAVNANGQVTAAANVTITPAASNITGGAALSKTDDTNVTLTLGGSASSALLAAASITAGWTGTLASTRLNANVVQGVTNDTNVTGSVATQTLTLGWTGTLAAGRLNANVVQEITNDTNVTGSIATQTLTLGWSGTLAATRGGTGQSVYAVGDLLYASTTTALSKLADVNVGSVLVSGGTNMAPAWSANPVVNTVTVADVAYGSGWNGSATVPTQNAVYDKIESISGGGASIGFSVHKNGTNQTGIASATYTKLTFGTELYDVGGYFTSDAWTPLAGKVHITCLAEAGGTITAGSVFALALYKNGAIYAQQLSSATTNSAGGGFAVDDICNGTDYYEIYVYITLASGTGTISGNTYATRFTGHWSGT